jgi:hypothetical protein
LAPARRRKQRPRSAGREAGGGSDRGEGEAVRIGELMATERVATAVVEPSRSQRRDEELRTQLAPLAPGERPRSLMAAVVVCVLLGAGNAIAFAADARIDGHHPGAGVLFFSAAMAMLAGGMWTRRYLAVLAFEALLALAVLVFSLFLIEASNLEAVLLCVAVIGGGGWLFWKLVRVMGRLSAPPQSSS